MNDQHHAVGTLPTVCAITKFNRLVLLGDETVVCCENGNELISTICGWIIIIIIIIIIVIIISFMQGIYTYIPETNCVPREYSVAVILLLLFKELISLVSVLNLL